MCAKVRVRIVQELVLTREGFNARLEIENGETSSLENINVEIEIRETDGSPELVNDKFSIGKYVSRCTMLHRHHHKNFQGGSWTYLEFQGESKSQNFGLSMVKKKENLPSQGGSRDPLATPCRRPCNA